MVHYMVFGRDNLMEREIDIRLGILRKRDMPHRVCSRLVGSQFGGFGDTVKHIARRLKIVVEIDITPVGRTLPIVGIGARITPIEDKMVFVTGFEHRRLVDEIGFEAVGHPRQVYITDIYQVKAMSPPSVRFARDSVVEPRIGNGARVFVGALLVVVGDIDTHARRESESRLGFALYGATAVLTPFVTGTAVERQLLRAAEDILVDIAHTCRDTPVACRIGTLQLRRHAVQFAARDGDMAIQLVLAHRVE